MENRIPRISIIIIFFNAELFLSEAVDSVLLQSISDWELLLVDDGSTDQSPQIAQQYVSHHPTKISYFTHPGVTNRGTAASRNLGIRKSRGEFICFLDADDVMFPDRLENQLAILIRNSEAAMVYGPDMYWYSWQHNKGGRRDFIPRLGIAANTLIAPPSLKPLFQSGVAACPGPSIFLRRSALEKVGGYDENFVDLFEDQALVAKVLLEFPVYVSNKCWYKYRQHDLSICARSIESNGDIAARKIFLEWLADYVDRKDIQDPVVRQVINRAYRPYRYYHRLYRSRVIFFRAARSLLRQTLPASLVNNIRDLKTLKRGI